MIYVEYIFKALLSLLFKVIVWITSPIWAFIAAAFNLDKLPGFLSWVHTHDDDIYGSKTTKDPRPERFLKRFKVAVWWLLRNPGYGFAAYVLGFKHEDIQLYPTIEGRYTKYDLITKGDKKYFSYRVHIPYGNRHVKAWFGWHPKKQAGYHMLKIDFNPFKTS